MSRFLVAGTRHVPDIDFSFLLRSCSPKSERNKRGGVAIGLLISPERIRLVYAPKGESSGQVTFPVHQMTMAANWPMLAALHLLLHSDRLFIGDEKQRLPAILEASVRYQNEVSIRLAGQVLRARNELVRGFQEADRADRGKILADALQHDPNHIYGGMLTTLMRMVFVLYAEDRSLMGSDETWLQNYSISGLYERLRADEGQYPDTMDSRYGAWAQIVTLTRLLYDGGGHGSWRLPPRHGGLFDPDAYPFLEGRAWESKRDATAMIEPPLVSDGIIFRILQDLLYLEGERISYRALDVEQIGSVYEAMMGFTVETAHGISIGLGSDHLVINLEELLTKKRADRPRWLKENAACEVTGKAIEQLKSAASVDELLAALRRRISKLHLDQNSNPVTVPTGGIYLQPTEERRRSGSHYTPRSLTQPIVKTTLDPVLAQLGDNPTPEQILGLKVCDPAMGSGAFLVEACRYLGEKLEKAWNAHSMMPPIPADQDPLLHARRIVAQRCLYRVDKNPFAVNLAKLSLWPATFAKDHPFTFVDHTLRFGDSLVGLTAQQVEAFHWQPKEEGALLRDMPSRLRHVLNARAQILDAADEIPYETLAQKLAVTDEQMIDLRLAGDLTIAAFFAADKPKERETRRFPSIAGNPTSESLGPDPNTSRQAGGGKAPARQRPQRRRLGRTLLPGNRALTEALHGVRVPRRRCLCQAGDLRGTGGAQREARDPHSVQRKSGAEHRRTVDATLGQTEPQASGLVQEFPCQASWKTARRVVAKVAFQFGELLPRVGLIVTKLETDRWYGSTTSGTTTEQWIKEGKQAVKMTRLVSEKSLKMSRFSVFVLRT